MSCCCGLCTRHRQVQEIKNSGDVQKMAALIDELENDLANLGFEHQIQRSILAGTWPSARDYALRILSKTDPKHKSLYKVR